jgi:hypothetical protein
MTAESGLVMDDRDHVLPTIVRPSIPVHETPTACAGAVASYVFRRIAYRAGAYAPGIDDALFFELHATSHGSVHGEVERWFADRSRELERLGYRLCCRRVTWALPEVARWVCEGRGYRGAVLATSYARLHPHHPGIDAAEAIVHAVGLTSEPRDPNGDDELVMIDPWSRATKAYLHSALDLAHRDRDRMTLLCHWRGWA